MRELVLKFHNGLTKEADQWEEVFSGVGSPRPFQEFLALHDPKVVPTGKLHIDSNGFDLVLNDLAEVQIAKSLASSGFAKAIHGQTFAIPFRKPWANNPSPYYPDFIVYTYDSRIAFLEVKSILGMCQDETIAKYTHLAAFCKRRGYLYGMIDVERIPFELYLWPNYDAHAKAYFEATLSSCGGFNQNHIAEYLCKLPPAKRNAARRSFASLILLNPYIENRYCHDDPRLCNAVRVPTKLPYKAFSI